MAVNGVNVLGTTARAACAATGGTGTPAGSGVGVQNDCWHNAFTCEKCMPQVRHRAG